MIATDLKRLLTILELDSTEDKTKILQSIAIGKLPSRNINKAKKMLKKSGIKTCSS